MIKDCGITTCAYYDMCNSEETRNDYGCDEPMQDVKGCEE